MPVVLVLFLTVFSGEEVLYTVEEPQPLWGTVQDGGDPIEDCWRRGTLRGYTMTAYAKASGVVDPHFTVNCR